MAPSTQQGVGPRHVCVGVLLSFPGASYIAGMDLLHKQQVGTPLTVIAVVAFNVIMLMLLEIPLVGYATRPESTAAAVQRFSDWLTRRLALDDEGAPSTMTIVIPIG